MIKIVIKSIIFMFFLLGSQAFAMLADDLAHLKAVYPNLFTISLDEKSILWNDGAVMPVGVIQPKKSLQEKIANPTLADQIHHIHYPAGKIDLAAYFKKNEDPGRIRYEPFSRKMYGDSENEVKTHLVVIDWMPNTFKKEDGSALYRLPVTTVNQVNEKLQQISQELDDLVSKNPNYKRYLSQPGGTFSWRVIANTNRLSYHSFGMTIDINVNHSSYWQWNVYKLYIRPSENAIKPENIGGNAVVLVRNKIFFVENHQLVKKNNMDFAVDILLSKKQKNELMQMGITDGEIKRDQFNNALINAIMQQALANGNRPIPENIPFHYYPSEIPWPIVLIFEKHGFIWGGKWHHFDTMHFEYRPELFYGENKNE